MYRKQENLYIPVHPQNRKKRFMAPKKILMTFNLAFKQSQSLSPEDLKFALQSINVARTGLRTIPLNTSIPKEHQEAHHRVHAGHSVDVSMGVNEDGCFNPFFLTMNGKTYKLTEVF